MTPYLVTLLTVLTNIEKRFISIPNDEQIICLAFAIRTLFGLVTI